MAGTGRVVLIVEDEHLIRLDVAETFAGAGFKVFQVATAEKAIELLEREPTIRVVWTDVDLPGTMDGIALAHHVRRRWPPTILLVSSGRTLDRVLPAGAQFLEKPYLSGSMTKAIQAAVNEIAAKPP
jgi:DNA-binding response OmpR family regulator